MKIYRNSLNLFDKTNATLYNAYLTNERWASSEDSRSVKIPCLGNTTYTISVSDPLPIFRVAISDNENLQVGDIITPKTISTSNIKEYSFTTNADSVWIIFQGSTALLSDWFNSFMLNAGSSALPYEPYNVVDWYDYKYKLRASGAWSELDDKKAPWTTAKTRRKRKSV